MQSVRLSTADALIGAFIACRDVQTPTGSTITDGTREFTLESRLNGRTKEVRLIVTDSTPTSKWTAVDVPGVSDVYRVCDMIIPQTHSRDLGWLIIEIGSLRMELKIEEPAPARRVRCPRGYPLTIHAPEEPTDYPPTEYPPRHPPRYPTMLL